MKFTATRSTTLAFLVVLALLLAPSAFARTKLLDSWENDEATENKPSKVAVIAVLPDALMREAAEVDFVKGISSRTAEMVAGTSLPGLGGGIRGELDTEKAVKALEAAGVDGVIVIFYAGSGVTGTYERSDYWLRYEGSGAGYSYYNWGRPYFVDVYSVQQGPGYSDFTSTVWVESSYYDLDTKEPVWRIVTETKDIEHSDAVKGIAKRINSQMKKSRL